MTRHRRPTKLFTHLPYSPLASPPASSTAALGLAGEWQLVSAHSAGGNLSAAASVDLERSSRPPMWTHTVVIERDPDTRLLVGYVPGFPGAHSQAETLDELQANMREVIEMLLEDGEPTIEGEFVGTQLVSVAT